MTSRLTPAAVALLIVYGSLYPFEFSIPAPDALAGLLTGGSVWSSRGDVLGNVALFVPWGVAWIVSATRLDRATFAMPILLGSMLAFGVQVAQLFVPQRDPSLGDVVWNFVGATLGLAIGYWLRGTVRRTAPDHDRRMTAALLLACIACEWLPLVPSLDAQLIKSHFKQLLDFQGWGLETAARSFGIAALTSHLTARLVPSAPVRSAWAVLALMAVGKLFIVHSNLNIGTQVGLGLGGLAWWALSSTQRDDATALATTLALAFTISALAPFEFRGDAPTFHWLPFEAMLTGSMLANSGSLARNSLLLGATLYMLRRAGGHVQGMAVALALWVMGLEIVQAFMPGRTGDVTLVVITLALGWWLGTPQRSIEGVQLPRAMGASEPRRSQSRPVAKLRTRWWLVPLIALALYVMLRLPGIPYNVRELFRGDGHPLALLTFSLALLWIGAGSALVGRQLARVRQPGLWLGPLVFGCALVSLVLVALAVTDESLADVAGSTNRYWFVTQRLIWGEAWAQVFAVVGQPSVDLVERCLRYAALYGPLPIVLGGMLAARGLILGRDRVWARLAGLTLAAGLLLWLCKAVAFDWSSTDNLNELIARDGPWGLGGGGYLYALLTLLCANGWALSVVSTGRPSPAVFVTAGTLLALPLGWWLLSLGLEPEVQKYGNTFSGVQFILGPDRRNLLPPEQLFLRWAAVQLGVVLILAAGLRLGGLKSEVQHPPA